MRFQKLPSKWGEDVCMLCHKDNNEYGGTGNKAPRIPKVPKCGAVCSLSFQTSIVCYVTPYRVVYT